MIPEVVQAMVRLLEVKDLSTAAHTWRVVLYTRALAEDARLDAATISRLTYAAALHDIGKLDIPDAILQKPGKLTEEEFAIMKTHTTLGHEHLRGMGEDDPIAVGLVRHHHERWDGLGYPDRLVGESIPLVARYFAVVDSFDAMTSIRPYRSTVGERAAQAAMEEISASRGTRYAPDAVDRFRALYEAGAFDWIRNHFNDESQVPEYAGLNAVDLFLPPASG